MRVLPTWCRDVVVLDARAPLPLDRPFTAAEADLAGVGADLRTRLLSDGLLRPMLRGVLVATQVPDSFRLRVAAARLVVPHHAVVVDRTAAWIHGVDALPRSAVHEMPSIDVYSTSGSRMRRTGVASGIRDLRAYDVEVVDDLLVTTALRTACDLGRLLWRFDAIGAIDGFVRRGVDVGRLQQEVERFKGYRGVVQLRHLVPLADANAESPPESALRLHWHDSDLPWPETQIWEYDDDGAPRFRIDIGRREVGYGVEYFGEEFHSEAARARDEQRIAWLEQQRGWTMDVFTKDDVYGTELAASGRLRSGFHRARAALGLRDATYIDLAR